MTGAHKTMETKRKPSPADVPHHQGRVSEEAIELFRRALVWDMVFVYEPEAQNDVRLFQRWLSCGVNFVSVHPAGDRHNIGEAMRRIARARKDILSDDRYILVERVEDILTAQIEGKLAVGLHLEGFRCLERDLNLVELYYRLGIRFCHPIFNLANSIGGGSAERIDVGLTGFGIKVIQEMNRVGMLVDGSHAGYRATMDMIEVSEAPVMFSHMGCDNVHRHFRNIKDDQIRACAASGGVVGITSAGFYLGGTSTETYFRHVDHVVQLVGPQHVGIGLDYLGQPCIASLKQFINERPDEWPGQQQGAWEPMACFEPEQLCELTETMIKKGYGTEDIYGVLGGNFLRLCKRVWR